MMNIEKDNGWPFEDPPNVAVFTTDRIMKREDSIFYVSHDADGAWQFHSNSQIKLSNAKIVALHRVYALDDSLRDIADLPLGWIAERKSIDEPWIRSNKN
jgi:hypothetical protein